MRSVSRRVLAEDRVLDLVLSPRGRLTVKSIAAQLGMTPTRVSQILRSSAFQERLAAARAARHQMLSDRLLELVERSSDRLLEALETDQATVGQALEIARFAAETLGYSPRQPAAVVNLVDAAVILQAREAIRAESGAVEGPEVRGAGS